MGRKNCENGSEIGNLEMNCVCDWREEVWGLKMFFFFCVCIGRKLMKLVCC